MKPIFILLLLLPKFSLVKEHPLFNWELEKDKDGIKVFTRHSETSNFNDIRIETDLVGNIYQIASILLDVDKYTDWAYATKKSVLIKKISNQELIYYSEISTPWPASNRDFYAHSKMSIDSVSNSLTLVSVGVKDYLPENKNLVRVPFSKGNWVITSNSGKGLHLVYELELNPGGSIPAWIINMFITKGPMETFTNLKQKMKQLNSQ